MTGLKNPPLEGIRVLEFGHMVMGPSCGLILADLGAEVIKIEPQGKGDKTRYLESFGSGFHCTFNRNKKSLAIDLKSEEGRSIILDLVKSSDLVTENFREGTLDKLGLGYESIKAVNPQIIYCSMKGFLSGPYQNRAALDEVVQMMGGLAYMTGPPGRPSRTGASVNDIMGGMFGVIGILSALYQREKTGNGCLIKSGLFENCVLLMAQHIASYERTGKPSKSLFERETQPWPVYDLFNTKDGEQIFIGLVTDGQWVKFCQEFGLRDFLDDPELQDNASRVATRNDRILPRLASIISRCSLEEIVPRLDNVGCPYAPVAKPESLLDDVHLNESDGFVDVEIEPGKMGRIPRLPLQYDHWRPDLRLQPPLVGEHSRELLYALGHTEEEVDRMISERTLSETPRVA
jgi:crotonobetainyl-CoA:carnitine CoA-transferase CaiB-like acyl-CoA transferase